MKMTCVLYAFENKLNRETRNRLHTHFELNRNNDYHFLCDIVLLIFMTQFDIDSLPRCLLNQGADNKMPLKNELVIVFCIII